MFGNTVQQKIVLHEKQAIAKEYKSIDWFKPEAAIASEKKLCAGVSVKIIIEIIILAVISSQVLEDWVLVLVLLPNCVLLLIMPVYIIQKNIPSWFRFFNSLTMEVVKRRKNSRVLAISFSDQRVIKNDRDQANFQVLYPTIYPNKSFRSLKSY